jgi:hypothetical protein
MKLRIKPSDDFRSGRAASVALVAGLLASLLSITVSAQNMRQEAVNSCQQEAQHRVNNENGRPGARADLTFDGNPQINRVSNARVEVTGTGRFSSDRSVRTGPFSYTCVYNTDSKRVSQLDYKFEGPNSGVGGGGYNPPGGGVTQTISCASDDGGRRNCPVDARGGVRLLRQRSGAPCTEGQTWGYDRANIWVDRGCRADFEVVTSGSAGGGGYRPGGGGGGSGGGGRPDGRVTYSGAIINRNSGKGLDVENRGSGTRSGSNVQQWDYANQPNQKWDVIELGNGEFAILSQGSGMVLDVQGRSTANASNVEQLRWNGGANQRWRLEQSGGGYFRIVNAGSGKCLDVADQSRENGANVQLYDCHGQGNQQWRLGQ